MNKFKKIDITKKISLANNLPLTVIAGPCVIESRKQVFDLAEKLKDICLKQECVLKW